MILKSSKNMGPGILDLVDTAGEGGGGIEGCC
jgi:hypothetical protein